MRSESSGVNAGSDCEPGFRGVISASFGATDALADQDTGGCPRHDLRFGSANQETISGLGSLLGGSGIGPVPYSTARIKAAADRAGDCRHTVPVYHCHLRDSRNKLHN